MSQRVLRVTVQSLDSLTTQTRQFQAMLFLPLCPMVRDILRPCNMRVFAHEVPPAAARGSLVTTRLVLRFP